MTTRQAYRNHFDRRKIDVEYWQLDEIMKFVSELVGRMRTHSIHYMMQSSSSFRASEQDRTSYEQLVNDRRDVWKIWQTLRDLTGKPETERGNSLDV